MTATNRNPKARVFARAIPEARGSLRASDVIIAMLVAILLVTGLIATTAKLFPAIAG